MSKLKNIIKKPPLVKLCNICGKEYAGKSYVIIEPDYRDKKLQVCKDCFAENLGLEN